MGLIAESNFIGRTVIIIGAVAGFLAISSVALRVLARKIKGASLDSSDWTCIAALLFALTLLGSTVNTVIQGLGQPVEDITLDQLTKFSKGMLVGISTWTASNTLVRISMILLYLRLFPSRKFRIICWAFLIENIACAVATFTTAYLICRPFAYNWDRINTQGHCGNQQRFYLWHGIQNLLSDVITIIMPMPLLWNLQLPWTKKISLMLLFAMGAGICVITMIRTIEVAHANQQEITSDYASIGLLSILEPLLGIVNCSLPLLRPVLQSLSSILGNTRSDENSWERPSVLPSIGSKRTRPPALDPYPLETLVTSNGNYNKTSWKGSTGGGSESLTNLVGEERISGAIRVKTDWDIRYKQVH